LVDDKRRVERLLEADRLRRDHVHERPPLQAGEDHFIDSFGVRLPTEDEAAAWATECFVRRCGDKIGVRHWRRMNPRRDEARDMRHIDHQVGPDLFGDLAEPLEVDHAGVGRRPDNQHLRTNLLGLPLHLVVVDPPRLFLYPVRMNLKKLTGETDLAAVREVSAMRKGHPHDRIARLEDRKIDRHVRLRTGVGLHVDMLRAKKPLRPLNRQTFDDIDILAPAVVTLARIALGIFVGHQAPLRSHDGGACLIFRGDEDHFLGFTLGFVGNGLRHLRIELL
jgi:hypothetical protein